MCSSGNDCRNQEVLTQKIFRAHLPGSITNNSYPWQVTQGEPLFIQVCCLIRTAGDGKVELFLFSGLVNRLKPKAKVHEVSACINVHNNPYRPSFLERGG